MFSILPMCNNATRYTSSAQESIHSSSPKSSIVEIDQEEDLLLNALVSHQGLMYLGLSFNLHQTDVRYRL